MKKISSRSFEFKRMAQISGPENITIILKRMAGGARVSPGMLSALKGSISTDPSSVASALKSFNPNQIAKIIKIVPELSSVAATEAMSLAPAATTVAEKAIADGVSGAGLARVVAPVGEAAGAGEVGLTGTTTSGVRGALSRVGSAVGGAGEVGLTGTTTSGVRGALSRVVAPVGEAATAVGSTLGVGTGVGASILVGVPLILATPWLMEKWFGSRDEIKTKDQIEAAFIQKAEEVFEPIWNHDVSTTINPWAGTSWSSEKSGDLGEIVGNVKNNIIQVILRAALSGKTNLVSSDEILKQIEDTGVADINDMRNDKDLMSDVDAASKYFTDLASDILKQSSIAQRRQSASAVSASLPNISPTSSGFRGTNPCIESSSEILVAKGYLSAKVKDWTPEFDAAFCDYINAGQKKVVITPNSWVSVARQLGYAPTATGACDAIKTMENSVPTKTATPAAPTATTAPSTDQTKSAPIPKLDVLAAIISVLYNEKLIDIKGIDFSNEKKQITALVDAAGGPAGGGFDNAAKILLEENPSIGVGLPDKLSGPVDKEFVKNNKDLSQSIVMTVRNIYRKANPGIAPGLEKATVNVKEYLSRSGSKVAATLSGYQQIIEKRAQNRREKIRAKMIEQLTPEEKAMIRRAKIRENV